MADMLVPDARFRSPTAAAGLSDALDGHVYSAINTAHGGNSQARAFIQAQGGAGRLMQALVVMVGSGYVYPCAEPDAQREHAARARDGPRARRHRAGRRARRPHRHSKPL